MTSDNGDPGSFDPRLWVSPEALATAPASTLPSPVVPRAAASAPKVNGATMRRFGPPLLALTVIGAGWASAWAGRAPTLPNAPTAPITAAAVAPGQAAPAAIAITPVSRRVLNLKNAGELHAALAANGIDQAQADAATRAAQGILGSGGGELRAEMVIEGVGNAAKLQRLALSFADSSGAVVEQKPDGSFVASKVAAQVNTDIVVRRGQMGDDNFYSSAVAAGVTDSLINDFANAFVFDFNFQTEITAGDVFEAAFEQDRNAAGQPVGAPHLLYASMVTSGKSKQLYRFQPAGEEAAWFDGNGRSIKKSFMRTPIEGAHVTSKFGMRFHPVLHYTRLHGGTDFAAPIGTPIYAAAAGVVTSASPSACAGNMVIIKHDNGWETRYFHLVRYAEGVVAGLRVAQGFTVGYVGTTGFCTTGPHLHYEVHINGEKVDPQSIPTEEGQALAGDKLKAFLRERDRIDVARARYTG